MGDCRGIIPTSTSRVPVEGAAAGRGVVEDEISVGADWSTFRDGSVRYGRYGTDTIRKTGIRRYGTIRGSIYRPRTVSIPVPFELRAASYLTERET
jgi:hypothetical protein